MSKFSKKSNLLCPLCRKKTLLCIFDDGEPTHGDSIFTFTHRCENNDCDYHESRYHHIGYDQDSIEDWKCDFCGRNWLKEK